MKLGFKFLLGTLFFLSRGAMSEQSHDSLSQHWMTIIDEKTGLSVDFPNKPLEMNFDIPYQNNPPHGHMRIYSLPTQKGLLAVATFHPLTLKNNELTKEQLNHFFEEILIPHFFFDPAAFQNHPTAQFKLIKLEGHTAASFQFSFQDREIVKKLEGTALVKDQILYIPFYLSSEVDFDQSFLNRFLESIRFPI